MGITAAARRLMKRAGQAMGRRRGDDAVIRFSVKSRRKLGWAFFVGMQGR